MTERRLIKSSSQAVARQWPELVSGGKPNGMPIEVLTGFVRDNGDAMGRPVGVALDQRGGLVVADDVGNAVWRVSGAQAMTRR